MKFKDRIKQFGFVATLKNTFFFLIRNIVRVDSYIVLIIENHRCSSIDDRVFNITNEKIELWTKMGFISEKESTRFQKFLNLGSIGYYIEIQNELAAWGFVETKGSYQYGKYFYQIPESMHILKNLFVRPKYRGMSLGKYINEARINNVPDSFIPCGFVVPKNRYAIRNLKMYGFKEYLKISHISWFKSFKKIKIQILENNKSSQLIISGFKNE